MSPATSAINDGHSERGHTRRTSRQPELVEGPTNQDLAYDSLGNITSKLDVGSYTYHASKKHQVISTGAPTNWSFGYDANGNMTSGRGATLTWTSYNYPASITNGADTASFSYTPDRQYWKQVSNYTSGGSATTLYIGGLLEKVTTSTGSDFRHYIRAGGSTIIVSRQSTGTNSMYYVTSDHLGSSSAITNSSGGILVNSSFDAFGKRRGANWSGNPSAGDWSAIASTTRRGFTEHSMLDNLGLIHMNGRVQDPWLGRFVSADPFVTEPLNTQSFNRYSYVVNNPLGAKDPSGFKYWKHLDGNWEGYGCLEGCKAGFDYTVWSDAALEIAVMSLAGDPMVQREFSSKVNVVNASYTSLAAWSGIAPVASKGESTPFDCDPTTPDCQSMVDYIEELKGQWSESSSKELEEQIDSLVAEQDQAYGRDVIDAKGEVHKAGGDLPLDKDPRYQEAGSKPLGVRPTEQQKRDRANFAEDQRKKFEQRSVNERASDPTASKKDWATACSYLRESHSANPQGLPLPDTVCDR